MKKLRKPAALAFMAAAMLATGFEPGIANAAAANAATRTETIKKLNASLQTELKSVVQQKNGAGVTIAAVVRLKNVTGSLARVPEYELHARTADGVSYKLDASTGNARSVQPQAEVELGFMTTVEGVDELELVSLQWVEVNKYVYPKKEKVVLEMAATGVVWGGIRSDMSGVPVAAWRQPFEIKALKSPLQYTAVAVNEQTSEAGLSTVVKLLVQNPSANKQTVPAFVIEGYDDKEAFAGRRVEAGNIELLPGEDAFIHLALPKKPNSVFENVVLSTTETFLSVVGGTPQASVYTVGRIALPLPSASASTVAAARYTLGQNVEISRFSESFPKEIQVALVELSMHETPGASYQTLVAKVKVTNKGTKASLIPPFMAELANSEGYQYVGTRQSNAPMQVLPGLATVVSYAFTVPASETGKDLTIKLQEPVAGESGAVYRSDLAAVKLDARQPGTDRTFSFYPYTVQVKSKHVSWMYNIQTGYMYKLKLDLEIEQDPDVMTDRDFSLMEVEIVDALGRTLGSTELSFVNSLPNGNRRLLSGETIVNFDNLRTEQMENNLSICIYESIQTPAGTVRRLVTTLK